MLSKPTGLIAFLFLASSLAARPQTDNSDALKLLGKVSKRYADATSYRIEAIKESRLSSELSSSWHKEMLTAEQARGNRYRFEGRSSSGSGIVVSDGVTEWNLHRTYGQYIKRPPGTFGNPLPKTAFEPDERPELEAFWLRRNLATVGDSVKSAHFLAEETISIGDHRVTCLVVTFGPADLRTPFPYARTTRTFWIDRERSIIVKSLLVSEGDQTYGSSRPPAHPILFHSEEVTLYPVAELDEPVPDTDFAFTVPQDASLVEQFPPSYAVTAASHPTNAPPKLPANEPAHTPMLVDGAYIVGVGGIGIPKCIACPNPSYSDQARSAKVSGIVVLHLIVTAEGQASNIQVKRSLGYGLDEQAIETVGKWRFEPALGPEDKPVPVWTDIEVNFRIK